MGSTFPSLAAVIVFLVAADFSQAREPARDLLNDCQSLERGKKGTGNQIQIPNTKEALVCWGYMQAMQDLTVWADADGHRIMGSCPPEKATRMALIHSFVTYARSHPSQLKDNAALVVLKAFQEAFPCDQG